MPFCYFEKLSRCVAQAGLKLPVTLLSPGAPSRTQLIPKLAKALDSNSLGFCDHSVPSQLLPVE